MYNLHIQDNNRFAFSRNRFAKFCENATMDTPVFDMVDHLVDLYQIGPAPTWKSHDLYHDR